MFVRIKTTPNSPRKSVQIVENVRIGNKVKQKIVRYVGIAMDDNELAKLKDLAAEIAVKLEKEREKQLSLFDDTAARIDAKKKGRPKHKTLEDIIPPEKVALSEVVEEKRIVEGVHEIAGTLYDDLGFDQILKNKRLNKLLKDIVLVRMIDPTSKAKSCRTLKDKYNREQDLDRIYRMMDEVFSNIPRIRKLAYNSTVSLFPQKIDVIFFDVTTLYFESTVQDELREFGYSKDQKTHCTQIVLSLATNEDGLPVGYEIFIGNKAETRTLLACLQKWQEELPIKKVTLVADRAMCSRNNLIELEKANISYVVAMPLRRTLNKEQQEAILQEDGYNALEESFYLKETDFEGKRLLVTYSEKRANKDQKDRERIIEKLQKKAKKGNQTKKLVSNRGYLKYIEEENQPGQFIINEEKVAKDAAWDGYHAILTNDKEANASDLLQRYRRLWVIEESFRINKHNLAMRPIYHYKPERIHAHIAICYLSFTLLRQLQYRIRIAQEYLSIDEIRQALLSVEASILIHKETKDRYRLPSNFTNPARKIYKAFGKKRSQDASVYLP